jgi:hypothetical protein
VGGRGTPAAIVPVESYLRKRKERWKRGGGRGWLPLIEMSGTGESASDTFTRGAAVKASAKINDSLGCFLLFSREKTGGNFV